MALFDGLERSEYQDVLRAVGRLMDTEGFRSFRLIEQDDSIVLQAMRAGHGLRGFETYLLTADDVQALLRDAYRLRGSGRLKAPPAGPDQPAI